MYLKIVVKKPFSSGDGWCFSKGINQAKTNDKELEKKNITKTL